MSIALRRNRGDSVGMLALGNTIPVSDSPDEKGVTRDRWSLLEVEEDPGSPCSSSSIGKNSDVSGESSEGEGSGEAEVESSFKGPLDCLDALEEVLPVRRGISQFYNGKSKSFTRLADAAAASSVKELAKPENPYAKKREYLIARRTSFSKTQHYPPKSRSSTLQGGNSGVFNSTGSSTCYRPPLGPPYKKIPPNIGPSSPPQQCIPPCRSFSLSDLQCVAAGTPNISD